MEWTKLTKPTYLICDYDVIEVKYISERPNNGALKYFMIDKLKLYIYNVQKYEVNYAWGASYVDDKVIYHEYSDPRITSLLENHGIEIHKVINSENFNISEACDVLNLSINRSEANVKAVVTLHENVDPVIAALFDKANIHYPDMYELLKCINDLLTKPEEDIYIIPEESTGE